jgi:hypothetical protein
MKSKLTLSVDAAAVRRAKAAARRRGVPLSRVVEEHFEHLATAGGRDDGEAFFARWQGTFRTDAAIRDDPRVAAIAAKHVR